MSGLIELLRWTCGAGAGRLNPFVSEFSIDSRSGLPQIFLIDHRTSAASLRAKPLRCPTVDSDQIGWSEAGLRECEHRP
jgi:hypothetical protein